MTPRTTSKTPAPGIWQILVICSSFCVAPVARATISLDISGSTSGYYIDLEKRKNTTGTIQLSLGLFSNYLSLVLGYIRSYDYKSGYRHTETANKDIIYYAFTDNSQTNAATTDLQLLLYNGTISPFIFGGVAKKDYYTQTEYPGQIYSAHQTMWPVYRYGGGFQFFLSQSFRLKASTTFTPDEKSDLIDGQIVTSKVILNSSDIGISYRIDG